MPDATLPTFAEPVAVLLACHRRFERSLDTLQRFAAGAISDEGDDAAAHAAMIEPRAVAAALDFIEHHLPLHAKDEEESLLPRLRARLRDPHGHFSYILEHIERDHVEAAELERQLVILGRSLLAAAMEQAAALAPPAVENATKARALLETLSGLRDIYESHIRVEDREVFPALRFALLADDLGAVAREMAQRRGQRIDETPRELASADLQHSI